MIWCDGIWWNVLWWDVIGCDVMGWDVMTYDGKRWDVMWCDGMGCDEMWRDVLWWQFSLCSLSCQVPGPSGLHRLSVVCRTPSVRSSVSITVQDQKCDPAPKCPRVMQKCFLVQTFFPVWTRFVLLTNTSFPLLLEFDHVYWGHSFCLFTWIESR